MPRITVNGGWIDYREPEDVPERLRRRVTVLAAQANAVSSRMGPNGENITEDDMSFLLSFNDAVAMCLVSGWSWEIPVTEAGLQELPGRVYDEVIRYSQALVDRLLPNFAVDPDPKAPTGN